MLHKEILKEKTFRLLTRMMADGYFRGFNLVGGTALSLYLGHRRSMDLALFSQEEFNVAALRKHLVEQYNFKESFSERQTLKGDIDGVFIDCIRYDYPRISPVTMEGNIRITGIPDLLAMKLSAITDSGDREKDFVDIAFFSTKFSLNNMLGFYEKKFQGASVLSPLKALLYFNDIKRAEPLILTTGTYRWELIADRLTRMVSNPNKVFEEMPQKVNPEIESLKDTALQYAVEYATGDGMHTGLPWLRKAYSRLSDTICKVNSFDESISAIIRDDVWDDIVSQCSTKLTDWQKSKLADAKAQVVINSRNKGMKL